MIRFIQPSNEKTQSTSDCVFYSFFMSLVHDANLFIVICIVITTNNVLLISTFLGNNIVTKDRITIIWMIIGLLCRT